MVGALRHGLAHTRNQQVFQQVFNREGDALSLLKRHKVHSGCILILAFSSDVTLHFVL